MPYTREYQLALEFIDRDELLMRIKERADFVLVDTVGKYDGNRFRIKGAKTIPYPEVTNRRGELIPFKEIVIYCKNRGCRASKKVALALQLLNIPQVKVYEGGIEEWLEHGLPVEEE